MCTEHIFQVSGRPCRCFTIPLQVSHGFSWHGWEHWNSRVPRQHHWSLPQGWQLLLSALCWKDLFVPRGSWELCQPEHQRGNSSSFCSSPHHFCKIQELVTAGSGMSSREAPSVPLQCSECSGDGSCLSSSPFWEQFFSSMMTLQCRNLSFLKNPVWKGTNTLWKRG